MESSPPPGNQDAGLKVICVNTLKNFVLFFGSEFSGHPCSVALCEQRNIRMLCFVKKGLERIKFVDRLQRQNKLKLEPLCGTYWDPVEHGIA